MKNLLALLMACALASPAIGQKVSSLPNATSLGTTDKFLISQGSGCATGVQPCSSVTVTAAQLSTFLGSYFQPLDGDLTSIAQASSVNSIYYRSAANTWAPVTLGQNFSFSGGSLTIPGLPITISGDASGSTTSVSGTLAITFQTVNSNPGTCGSSASLNVPLPVINAKGLVTACSTYALGSSASYNVGTSGGVIGLLNGNNTYGGNVSFTNLVTGSISGNAATATKLATAQTINGVAFDGSAAITINAVDTTARLAVSRNLSDVANTTTARTNIGAAASGANADITSFSNNIGIGITSPAAPLDVVFGSNRVRFNPGASNVTPNISLGYSSGKSAALGVGTNYTFFVFDQSGYFAIAGDSKTNIDGGSTGGGSTFFRVAPTGIGLQVATTATTITASGAVSGSTIQASAVSTVASLATCNAAARGTRTVVTDASSPTFLGTLSGGGTVVAPAFCNGSAWVAG